MDVISHENIFKNHACMTAKETMDVYSERSFYTEITNLDDVMRNQPKHQNICEVLIALVGIVHFKDERYSYLPCKFANNSDS